MENVKEFMLQAFAVILFCAGVSAFFIEYTGYDNALTAAKSVLQENVMYEQYTEQEECVISKGELMATLLMPPEYDMEINGTLISKTESIKANLSKYPLNNAQYIKTYAYDSKGKITRIIYTGI